MAGPLDTAIAAYQSKINEAAAAVDSYVSGVVETYLVILNSFDTSPGYHPTFESDLNKIVSDFNKSFESSNISSIYQPYIDSANASLNVAIQAYWDSTDKPSQAVVDAAYASVTDILNTLVNTTIPGIFDKYVPRINSAIDSLVARIKDARMAGLKADLNNFLNDAVNQLYSDIHEALNPAQFALYYAKNDVDAALSSIKSRFQAVCEFDLSIFDTVYRRSKLDEIAFDSFDYLSSVLNSSSQSVNEGASKCHFPTRAIDTFNQRVTTLPIYYQEMSDYISYFINNVATPTFNGLAGGFQLQVFSITSEFLSYSSHSIVVFNQYKKELYDCFPPLRLTGNFVIPDHVDWNGVNRFCIEVHNGGDSPFTLWFGWKFRTSTYPKSYTYNTKPDNLCTITPHSSVMCCTDVPFNEVFSGADPRFLPKNQYYIYIIPHLEAT